MFIYLFIPYINSLLHSPGTLEISLQLQRENMSRFKIFLTATITNIVINYCNISQEIFYVENVLV